MNRSDETEAIKIKMMDAIHDLAMSKEDATAVAGRFFKRFVEAFDDFECDEIKRGIHKGIIIGAMAHGAAALVAVSAASNAKALRREDAKSELKLLMCMTVDEVFESGKGSKRVDRKNSK